MLIERLKENPILKPNKDQSWEAEAVFNGCAVKKRNEIFLIYRALSLSHYNTLAQTELRVSSIGIARSKKGKNFYDRKQFIVPEFPWEKFGCEDPRITKLNNKYYIFYTALSTYPFGAKGIKVGLAISKDLKTIEEKHLVTSFNAKAMALFPEKINGKIYAVLTVHTDRPPAKICLASFKKESDIWSKSYWEKWYRNFEKHSLNLQRKPKDHIEIGAPPVKTEHGWLLLYSYIKNYSSSQPVFGVEAVLLDLKNPSKIIAKTKMPIITPEEYYERIGFIPNVIFPSGAIIKGKQLYFYYGATDTTCCLAIINLPVLLKKLLRGNRKSIKFARSRNNPIIAPIEKHPWESKATFNPAAIYLQGKVHLLYRAMSEDNTSVLGYATSKDGIHIDYRCPEPVYIPQEGFEQKLCYGGNSGCEDPRLTMIGNKIYMCYTAFDGKNSPRVALTSIEKNSFLEQTWDWAKPVLISPPNLDDKDACVFPEKFKGNYIIAHRIGEDIDLGFIPDLNFSNKKWIGEYRWVAPRKESWDSKKLGIASPPIKIKEGWILFYHGVDIEDNIYRVGALLLDRRDPTKIIARSEEPLFQPEASYEKIGQIPNVVFPCGAVLLGKKIFLYYGGGDKVIGVATIELKELLKSLKL